MSTTHWSPTASLPQPASSRARPFAVEDFSSYRGRVERIAREVFATYPSHALDEQAAPAYLEGFALSRWIFWRRLAVIDRLLPTLGGGHCLDFGCGMGVLLPRLKCHFPTIHGVDLEPAPSREFLGRWTTAFGESFAPHLVSSSLGEAAIEKRSLNLILALDVLEHVEDLEGLLDQFKGLLRPGGRLIISGPTENRLYRFGRRLVGFSGDYHKRNIYDIQRVLERQFTVKTVKRLPFPLTLFVVLSAMAR